MSFAFARIRSPWVLCLCLSLALVLLSVSFFAQQAHASQVTIAWNPDPGSVAGYDVYYGPLNGNYATYNVGDKTVATLQNLSSQAYYIAVAAYDSGGNLSPPSPPMYIYMLVASAGTGGTISPSGGFFQSQGANQTFTIAPTAGYQTTDVQVDGQSVGPVGSFTLTGIAAPHIITATFTAASSSYTIKASAGANGSISPSGAVKVAPGASKTFTITPASGYQTASVLVDGNSVGAVSIYTFSDVSANHTISATFSKPLSSYTITAAAGPNGSISPSGAVKVNYKASKTFAITPASGYQTASVLVDGSPAGAVSSYTFSSVAANHTISATFSATQTTYTITATAGANGSIAPSGAVPVTSGASKTFAITPASGYQVADVQVDGSSVGALTSLTLSNVSANHTISASFSSGGFTITPTAGANGTISPAAPINVAAGSSQTFIITPSAGYKTTDVQVDGSSIGALASYTFSNVTATHTISASFGTGNQPPVADAGPDQAVSATSATVTLNGVNSCDAGGPGITSYLWTQIGGTKVSLSNRKAAQTSFKVPHSTALWGYSSPIGALTFQLTVTNASGLKSTDTCIVNVVSTKAPPIANAGSDQTVNEGVKVQLNGSQSTDPGNGGLKYSWQQIDGPKNVKLSNSKVSQPYFTAPSVAGSLSFRLTVTNGSGLKSSDICYVNVTSASVAPAAVAGPTQTAPAGSVVTLDGTSSEDSSGGIASYLWRQQRGAPAVLSDPTSASPYFTSTDAGPLGNSLTFRLTVKDSFGLRSRAAQVVNVQ